MRMLWLACIAGLALTAHVARGDETAAGTATTNAAAATATSGDKVEARLKAIEERLGHIESKLGSDPYANPFASIDRKLDDIIRKLERMQRDIDDIGRKVDRR